MVHARSTETVRLVVRVRSMGIVRLAVRGVHRASVVRVRSMGIVRLAALARSMGIVRRVGMARSVRRVVPVRSTEIVRLVVRGVRQVSVALARVSRRTATGPVHVAMIDAVVTGRRRSRSVRHGR